MRKTPGSGVNFLFLTGDSMAANNLAASSSRAGSQG